MKREFIFRPEAVSTNSELKALILASGGPETRVLRAGRQTGGRGRQNKTFYSPDGGVYFSAAYPLSGDERNVPFLTLLAGLAVCRALESASPADYRIKWPNDIYLNGKKICGVLTELVSAGGRNTAVVGAGINTGIKKEAIPEALSGVMTSLLAEGLRVPDAAALTRSAVFLLDHYVYDCRALSGDTAAFTAEINARSYLTGKRVSADTGGSVVSGRVKEIASDGTLVLEGDRGNIKVRSGTVAEIL